jgi:TIR domain
MTRPKLPPSHVFLSHAEADSELASEVTRALAEVGVPVWVDRIGLPPGTENWERALRDALDASFVVLLLATPQTRDAHYVQVELAIAQSAGTPVLAAWVEGDAWTDCAPLRVVQSQYMDVRSRTADERTSTLERELTKIIRARTPKHQLFPDLYRAWHESLSRPNQYVARPNLSRYVSVAIDPWPYDRSREERRRNERVAVFDPTQYPTLDRLLDDLYVEYLRDDYAPSTYGTSWIITSRGEDGRHQGINPSRVVAPPDWFLGGPPRSTKMTPYWGRVSPATYGLVEGSRWQILDCATQSEYLGDAYERMYLLAVRDRILWDEVLYGPGKQPNPPVKAGYLDRCDLGGFDADAYPYQQILLENWVGRPFAGWVLYQTNKSIDSFRDMHPFI